MATHTTKFAIGDRVYAKGVIEVGRVRSITIERDWAGYWVEFDPTDRNGYAVEENQSVMRFHVWWFDESDLKPAE